MHKILAMKNLLIFVKAVRNTEKYVILSTVLQKNDKDKGGISVRKKSHISLAGFLVRGMDHELLNRRWRSFYLGNLLPDCKVSFVTVRHEYEKTYELMASMLKRLIEEEGYWSPDSMRYVRDLGQVFHYIADYFTFPHNQHFPGTLKDHCIYEEHLKKGLRTYIRNGKAVFSTENTRNLRTAEDILHYIREMHQEYMSAPRSVEEDCAYITSVCSQVLAAIPQLAAVPALVCAG